MPQELQELLKRIASREQSRSEATLQADIRQCLIAAPLELRDDDLLDVSLETAVGDGRRIDIEIGATVIEVKLTCERANRQVG